MSVCRNQNAGADKRHYCSFNPNLPSAAFVSMVAYRYMSPGDCNGSTHGILLGCAIECGQVGLLCDAHEDVVAGVLIISHARPDVMPIKVACSGQGSGQLSGSLPAGFSVMCCICPDRWH